MAKAALGLCCALEENEVLEELEESLFVVVGLVYTLPFRLCSACLAIRSDNVRIQIRMLTSVTTKLTVTAWTKIKRRRRRRDTVKHDQFAGMMGMMVSGWVSLLYRQRIKVYQSVHTIK